MLKKQLSIHVQMEEYIEWGCAGFVLNQNLINDFLYILLYSQVIQTREHFGGQYYNWKYSLQRKNKEQLGTVWTHAMDSK